MPSYAHPYAQSTLARYRVTPQRLRGSGGPTVMLGLPASYAGRGGSMSAAPTATGNAPIIGGTLSLGAGNVSFGSGGSLVGMVGIAVIVLAVLSYVGTKEHQR